MGSFFYIKSERGSTVASEEFGWLPLFSLIVFFVAYSAGYANVPFILMGEMFPVRYRSILGPLSSSFNLLCTFTVVRSFPEMQVTMGQYGAFWFFMCCTLAGIVFVYFLLPETKGKTLEEIEKIFLEKYNFDEPASKIESSTITNELPEVNTSATNDTPTSELNDRAREGFFRRSISLPTSNVYRTMENEIEVSEFIPDSTSVDSEDDEEDDGSLIPTPL